MPLQEYIYAKGRAAQVDRRQTTSQLLRPAGTKTGVRVANSDRTGHGDGTAAAEWWRSASVFLSRPLAFVPFVYSISSSAAR
jgi:hypothetical protein